MPELIPVNSMEERRARESLSSENASELEESAGSYLGKLIPTETDLGKRVVFCTTLDKPRHGTLR